VRTLLVAAVALLLLAGTPAHAQTPCPGPFDAALGTSAEACDTGAPAERAADLAAAEGTAAALLWRVWSPSMDEVGPLLAPGRSGRADAADEFLRLERWLMVSGLEPDQIAAQPRGAQVVRDRAEVQFAATDATCLVLHLERVRGRWLFAQWSDVSPWT
jgi:hypothetical protein